nr:unnamed protein product [Callosobruchus analis]
MNEDQALTTSLPKYDLATYHCRREFTHGGVAIFIQRNIAYKPIKGLQPFIKDRVCECAGISVHLNSVSYAILVFYRPPCADFNVFFNLFNHILCYVLQNFKFVILCGDLNVDWLTSSKNKEIISDIFESFDLKYILPTESTRDHNNSKSAIDYIVTNIPSSHAGNIDINISDHKLQFFQFETTHETSLVHEKPVYVYRRFFSDNNLSNLNVFLSTTDMSEVFTSNDVDAAWSTFWQNFIYCMDKACPLTKTKVSYKSNNSWVDEDIISESNAIKNLYWLTKTLNDPNSLETYKEAKKVYLNKLQLRKREYYQKRISEASNTPQEIWNIINLNTGRTKYRNSSFGIRVDGVLATYALVGLQPFWFHLGNVLLHAAASSLFARTCLRVADLRPHFAALAGLLFAVHPVHTEAVS